MSYISLNLALFNRLLDHFLQAQEQRPYRSLARVANSKHDCTLLHGDSSREHVGATYTHCQGPSLDLISYQIANGMVQTTKIIGQAIDV